MATPASPTVVLLTGSALRHQRYAEGLSRTVRLLGVVAEEKRQPAEADQMTPIVAEHLRQLRDKEAQYFANAPALDVLAAEVLRIAAGGVNSHEVFDWVTNIAPDYLALYGTSIVKDPLLSAFTGRVVNLHLGLSPYYRGAATNFWPLVNREPECVGGTFHLATLSVDAGPILHQFRPAAAPTDDAHDLGCKTIEAGARLAGFVIEAFARGALAQVDQRTGGRTYRRRDFCESAVMAMRANFTSGMIAEYLQRKMDRDVQFPIVRAAGG
jgi:folate-dependent phosphoribosylglycinamide formyltransferase PurN